MHMFYDQEPEIANVGLLLDKWVHLGIRISTVDVILNLQVAMFFRKFILLRQTFQ